MVDPRYIENIASEVDYIRKEHKLTAEQLSVVSVFGTTKDATPADEAKQIVRLV